MHDCLGMKSDCTKKGKVTTDMVKCASDVTEDFLMKLKHNDASKTPAAENLSSEGGNVHKLNDRD